MSSLIYNCFVVFFFLVSNIRVSKRCKIFFIIGLVVNFVKGYLIFDFFLVMSEIDFSKFDKKINDLVIVKIVIFCD